MRNLGVLFQEFFERYSTFEWDRYGISLRDGGRLFRKDAKGWIYGYQDPRNIAIEDPQDSCKPFLLLLPKFSWADKPVIR